MKFFVVIVGLAFVTACSDIPRPQSGSMQDSVVNNTVLKNDSGYLKRTGDSILIPSFTIEVSLSDKAEKKLLDKKETIIVAAFFIGQPKNTLNPQYRETGEFGLTSKMIELAGTYRKARFENVKFPAVLYDSLADKDITVMINVYSGRRSIKDNFLDCDIFEDKVSKISDNTYTIKGKLIGEIDERK